MRELTAENECYSCEYKRNIPGNNHISCDNYNKYLVGNDHGIRNGWFIYPICFDPIWKVNKCINFKKKQ